MKQLHLANIANVAYGYASFLRAAKQNADVLCYDLTHILSLPHWVEGNFDLPVEDEWKPPLDHPEIKALSIPGWYRWIRSQSEWVTDSTEGAAWENGWVDHLVSVSERYGRRWALCRDDVLAYRLLVDALQTRFFREYDIILGYAYGAVPALLASTVPYVAVEIGTLRDVVKEDNPLGRLLALAYRSAPYTIITNADCRSAAEALGLENYSYVPHPIDEDVFRPLPDEEAAAVKKSLCGSQHLLVAPARQAWDVKANHQYLHAYAELIHSGIGATLLIAEWGPDIDRARRLIKRLGLEQSVRWFSPVPHRRLARIFAAADLVLDQFGTFRTFGLTAPQAMACGTPCLLSFDTNLHSWCFATTPPVLAATKPAEIFRTMRDYLSSPSQHTHIRASCRRWILDHHSKAVVVNRMTNIIKGVISPDRRTTGFDALRSKKISLYGLQEQLTSHEHIAALHPGHGEQFKRRLRRVAVRFRAAIAAFRNAGADMQRLAIVEQQLQARAEADDRRLDLIEQQLQARLEADSRRLDFIEQQSQACSEADNRRLDLIELQSQSRSEANHRRIAVIEELLQARSDVIELDNSVKVLTSDLQSQVALSQQAISNVLEVMGKNRIEDRELLRGIRAGLMNDLVRARLALPVRQEIGTKKPLMCEQYDIDKVRAKLEEAGPLNWSLYCECLERGTRSYEAFPPVSCSTQDHPQADLFRAFLRPYLHGYILDVGCGPQPTPWYLADYPSAWISGIDPISLATDHPFCFVQGFGEFLPWANEQFEVVVSGTSLDHYYLLDYGLKSAFRVLRPGGHFVAWITEFAGAPPYDPYRVKMLSPYDAEHLYHVDRTWFLPLMSKMGFIPVEILHIELPFNQLFMSFEKPRGKP